MALEIKDSAKLHICKKKDLVFISEDKAKVLGRKKYLRSFKKYTVFYFSKPIIYNEYVIVQCRQVRGAAYTNVQLLLFKKINRSLIFTDELNYVAS
jgi:hypothetical protein